MSLLLVGVALLLVLAYPSQLAELHPMAAGLARNPVTRDVLLTLAAVVLIQLLARRAEGLMLKDLDDITARHKARKMVTWARIFLIGLAALLIWGRSVEGLGVFLGMMGAGLTLSIQETLLCIAGWILILTRKPFDLGDRIEVAGHVGDVVDVRVFYSSLLEVGGWCEGEQSTGRIVHMPNSLLFRGPTINYSQGFPFVWNELTVVVTFESDWEAAKQVLLEWAEEEAEKLEREVKRHLDRAQEQLAIKYRQLRPIVYTAIADQGVAITLRHLCPVRRRRGASHDLSEFVLRAFQRAPDIELAYPTTRFFYPPAAPARAGGAATGAVAADPGGSSADGPAPGVPRCPP